MVATSCSFCTSEIASFCKVVFPAVARRVEWSDSQGWHLKPDRRTYCVQSSSYQMSKCLSAIAALRLHCL